jgi:carbon storage regulator
MLVLSRRANQSIVVGDDIVITVLDIRGDQVRIGIRAPRDVTVHREEIHAQIRQENRAASEIGAIDPSLLPPAPGKH